MTRSLIAAALVAVSMTALVLAQNDRPMSPTGTAAAQVLGKWVKPAGRGAFALGGENYEGGKWIEITYGRPLKRGRDLWGSGAELRQGRAGGHADLARGRQRLHAAQDRGAARHQRQDRRARRVQPVHRSEREQLDVRRLVTWPAQAKYDPNNKDALWGSYFYTPDKDVLRVPMKLETLPHAIEQLTWEFVDMTNNSGAIAIVWDKTMASVPFKIGT